MDMDIDVDSKPDSKVQSMPGPQPSGETNKNEMKLTTTPVNLDEFAENIKTRMNSDDFYKCKLLSRSWFGKKKLRNITNFEQLANALKSKFQDNDRVFFLLIELMFIIKRFDLLRIANWCKHNAHLCIRNDIDPVWSKWLKEVESLNPNDKNEVVNKLGRLLVAENDYNLQQNLLESLDELFHKDIVVELERYLYKSNPPYPMDTSPCGICTIINNKEFNNPSLPDRLGTEIDREGLKSLWSDFDFTVEIFNNQTAAQIRGIVFQLSQRDHSKYSCVVLCILTHGEEDVVLGVDGERVNIDKEIIPHFYANKNKTLIGKPKLFFIQACQGGERMAAAREAVESDSRMFEEASMGENDVQSDAPSTHPSRADDFIFMATAQGFAAYRSKIEGSWFITTLVHTLEIMGHDTDLQYIATVIKNRVSKAEANMDGKACKQMPIDKSTLRRPLTFKKKNFK